MAMVVSAQQEAPELAVRQQRQMTPPCGLARFVLRTSAVWTDPVGPKAVLAHRARAASMIECRGQRYARRTQLRSWLRGRPWLAAAARGSGGAAIFCAAGFPLRRWRWPWPSCSPWVCSASVAGGRSWLGRRGWIAGVGKSASLPEVQDTRDHSDETHPLEIRAPLKLGVRKPTKTADRKRDVRLALP